MNKKKKITHRCEELLEYNKHIFKPCAIQYQQFVGHIKEKPTWVLKVLETNDEDWDIKFMYNIAKIKYCPFCGRKLNEIRER